MESKNDVGICSYEKMVNNNATFKKVLQDIRNLKYLNKDTINSIKCMNSEQKNEIIVVFNEILSKLKGLI